MCSKGRKSLHVPLNLSRMLSFARKSSHMHEGLAVNRNNPQIPAEGVERPPGTKKFAQHSVISQEIISWAWGSRRTPKLSSKTCWAGRNTPQVSWNCRRMLWFSRNYLLGMRVRKYTKIVLKNLSSASKISSGIMKLAMHAMIFEEIIS